MFWPLAIVQGFTTATLLTLRWVILCFRDCLVFGSIPGLYLLDASSIAAPAGVVSIQIVSRHCHMFSGRQNPPS